MNKTEQKISTKVFEGLQGWAGEVRLTKRDRVVSDGKGKVSVFLWGTEVGKFDKESGTFTLSSGGYRSNTTKSRINALAYKFSEDIVRVSQQNWTWWLTTRCPLTLTNRRQEFNGSATFQLRAV